MGSLGLGGLGSVGSSVLGLVVEILIVRHGHRVTPDGTGANLFNDRVVIVGHIDQGRGQSCRAFSWLEVFRVIVIERAEQTDAEPVITVIVARNRQPRHGLAFFHGWSRAVLPHGLLSQRLFCHGL